MSEQSKFDMSEADLVMQQLRAQLEADQNAAENGTADTAAVAPEMKQNTPNTTAPVLTEERPAPTEEKENAASAAEEIAREEAAAEGAPLPAEKPSRRERRAGVRKKRHRLPKLADEQKAPEAPLELAAREQMKRRAEALAKEQEQDLYWRGTAGAAAAKAPKANAVPKAEVDSIKQNEVKVTSPQEPPIEQTAASRRRGIRGAAVQQSEEMASLTVEGLLNDIFGSAAGPAGHAWFESAKETKKKSAEAQPDNVTGAEEAESQEQPVTEEGEPTLELGGKRIVLPREGELIRSPDKTDTPQQEPADEVQPPLFSAFSVKRQKEGARPKPSIARLSAEQMALKRSMEESDEEFKLLVDLDYEDELGEAIGFEKILEYHERRLNGRGSNPEEHRPARREKRRFEYTAHAHDIGLSKFYAKQRRRHLVNLAVTVLLLLLLVVYEHSAFLLSLFGEAPEGARYPSLYIACGLLLFLCGAVLLRRNLIDGFMQLVRLAPSDYSFSSVVVIVTLIHHAILFIAPAGSAMSLCLSPAMGNLFLLALSGLFNWYREFSAFRVVSSKQQKYALMSRVSVGNREGNAKLRLFEQEREERVYYVRPVGFVRNYFANTEKKTDHQRSFGAELLLVAALSCSFALFSMAMGGSLGNAWHTAFISFLFTVPVVSVLGTSLPMFCGTCLRLGRRGAIVGEGTVHECDGKTTLVLPDSACFKEMPHEQFELVKNCDAMRATVQIRALLEKIGSPLLHTVHVPPEHRLSPDAVTLTDVDEPGVAAVIAGERKTPILIGSVAYLQKYGIRVSPKKDGRYEELCRNMLCVAINNRLTALFIAHYRLEDEMLPLARLLDAEKLGMRIRSKDPGVHDGMLEELFADVELQPTVMKPLAAERDITAERVNATVVAIGSAREAARTFATCRRIRRAVKLGTLWQFVSIFFGATLAGALVFFNRLTVLPTFVLALYTFLWCGAHALTSYFMLREREEEK